MTDNPDQHLRDQIHAQAKESLCYFLGGHIAAVHVLGGSPVLRITETIPVFFHNCDPSVMAATLVVALEYLATGKTPRGNAVQDAYTKAVIRHANTLVVDAVRDRYGILDGPVPSVDGDEHTVTIAGLDLRMRLTIAEAQAEDDGGTFQDVTAVFVDKPCICHIHGVHRCAPDEHQDCRYCHAGGFHSHAEIVVDAPGGAG